MWASLLPLLFGLGASLYAKSKQKTVDLSVPNYASTSVLEARDATRRKYASNRSRLSANVTGGKTSAATLNSGSLWGLTA